MWRFEKFKIFLQLAFGPRFILGGDLNVKHTSWESQIKPKNGKEFLAAITGYGYNYIIHQVNRLIGLPIRIKF